MITLFGAPGSGKSEQGKLLSQKYGWEWVDVRTILLNLHDEDITRALEIGMSVDDDKATEAVQRILQRAKGGGGRRAAIINSVRVFPSFVSEPKSRQIILDGFPADHNQVKWMVDNGQIKDLQGAIILQVPRGVIWQRLVQRKRVDDTRAAIERREDIYDRSVTGMVRTLSMNGVKIGYVNGVGEPKDVLERIEEVLGDWGLVPKKQFAKISIQRERQRSNIQEAQIPDFNQ